MMRYILSLIFSAFLICAVSASWGQGVPNFGGMGVPNAVVPSGVVQNNLNAASDPTANNDQTQGYAVGSLWQNSTTGRVWVARSVSIGVAVWTMLELSDHPGYIVNNWYLASGLTSSMNTGINSGVGSIKCYAGFIKERMTIAGLGMRVSTVSAGGNMQAAIYANNAATGRPQGNALGTTGNLSTASAATVTASITSFQIEPGEYWFCSNFDNATATAISYGVNLGSMGALIGSAAASTTLANQGTLGGVIVSGTFGTWPNMTGQTFTETTGSSPVVTFQVGSVP